MASGASCPRLPDGPGDEGSGPGTLEDSAERHHEGGHREDRPGDPRPGCGGAAGEGRQEGREEDPTASAMRPPAEAEELPARAVILGGHEQPGRAERPPTNLPVPAGGAASPPNPGARRPAVR